MMMIKMHELAVLLCDHFSQGVNAMDRRELSVKIPLTEVPFVMRAMGFYPSEQEVSNRLTKLTFAISKLFQEPQIFINNQVFNM